jgi:hypothetical protein
LKFYFVAYLLIMNDNNDNDNNKWMDLWKTFTGKEFVDTSGDTMSVEDGIEKYAWIIAFWNSDLVKELPNDFVNIRLHAAIKRSGELEEKVNSQFKLYSGILHKILKRSNDILLNP